jgi:CdiA C-terminal tRNase domain
MLWAARNPDKVEQLALQLQEAGGGPPGLTLLPSSRLSAAERATGERLAQQLGVVLEESAHEGEEYIVRGTKKTIDAMGGPEAFQKGFMSEILASIDRHLNKTVDYTAIDLRGASQEQIKAVKDYVSSLSKEQQARIIYVQ